MSDEGSIAVQLFREDILLDSVEVHKGFKARAEV